jgi:hypothetical protein
VVNCVADVETKMVARRRWQFRCYTICDFRIAVIRPETAGNLQWRRLDPSIAFAVLLLCAHTGFRRYISGGSRIPSHLRRRSLHSPAPGKLNEREAISSGTNHQGLLSANAWSSDRAPKQSWSLAGTVPPRDFSSEPISTTLACLRSSIRRSRRTRSKHDRR